MNNNSITAKITGVGGNTAAATLEVSTDFHPIVRVAISSVNPESVSRNLIFKVFQESDAYAERCKPFIEKMESDCLKQEEDYFIPYLRMWPPQEGERVFTLACIVSSGKDNCAEQGDIYVEMPTKISGLKINNIPDGVIEDVFTYSTAPLELSLTSDADRTLTDIKAVPLIFYVLNNGARTDVGKVHLSVAPQDVFSEDEVEEPLKYLQNGPYYTHKIRVNGVLKEHDCLTAVRICAEKLLNVDLKGAIKGSFRIGEFEQYLKDKGFLASSISIDIGNVYGTIKLPITKEKNTLYFYVKKEIENSLGYHFYSMAIAETHTETLYINNLDPLNPMFSINDQFTYAGRGYKGKWHNKGYDTFGKRERTDEMEIEKLDNAINAEISDWQAWTKDGKNVTYPAIGKFLKLQRALFLLICLIMVASCHRKPKGDSELYTSMATESIKNDTISNHKKPSANKDSIRFLALIALIEQMDLSQCDSIKPIKEDLLMVFLENSNHDIISHFVEGFIFRFDYGYTKKPMMGLDVFTFDSEIYANRFAEIAFINETKEDKYSRVARFSNSIYRIVYLTDLLQSRIKYENLLAEWDKIYWDKVY